MARFRFRLQSVLDIKLRLEEQQRNAFAAANKRLQEENDKLDELYARKESLEEEGRRLRDSTLKIQDIIENEEAIARIKDFIEDQKAQVRLWEMKVEEERVKLVDMITERKMYERLREKAFDDFLEEEKHSEGVENDEHNSFVYGTNSAQ